MPKAYVTKTFPASRQVQQTYNQPATLEWSYVAPPGKILGGWYMDANLVTTGAGMSTTPLSQAIQSLQVYGVGQDGNGGLVADIDQYTLDLLSGVSEWIKLTQENSHEYRFTPSILDPVNVATGASLFGRWRIYAPLPGKAFKFTMNVPALTSVFGTGQTGGALAASIVPYWITQNDVDGPRRQYTLYAKQSATVTKAAWRSAYLAALLAPSEWSSIQSGINLGGKLSPEEITRQEDINDDAMLAYIAQSASAANPDVKPLTDASVNPVGDIWALFKAFDTPTDVSIGLNTAKTIKAIIYSDISPDKIAQNSAN